MLGLSFSSRLDWGSYIISIAKIASKKNGALIHSMKFLSLKVVLYLYKSTIWPFMEQCWLGAPSCYLELFGKLKNGYEGLLVLHLLHLLNFQLIVKMQPAINTNLVNVHLNWLNWFHSFILKGGLLIILIDCMIFRSPFLDVTRMSVNSFFPRTARLWNFMPKECFLCLPNNRSHQYLRELL